ncbi:hypothetical protein J6S88_01745 [bacterium]|nr:hypothetical protein [bacterium]
MQNCVGTNNVYYQNPNATKPVAAVPQQTIINSPVQGAYVPADANNPNQAQNYQVPNYSGVNIQIFNPSVATPGAQPPIYNVNAPSYQAHGQNQAQPTVCCYPANYYTQPFPAQQANTSIIKEDEKVKTEKRKVVELTDEYIKNLENYLNSQDKEVRYMGAKEVVARLEEDDSRCDDLALNALINKMLKDPYDKVRFLALASLKARIATGNDESVELLKAMQSSKSAYGMDAPLATEVLLQMSGKRVEKEFVVKEKQSETKTETSKIKV